MLVILGGMSMTVLVDGKLGMVRGRKLRDDGGLLLVSLELLSWTRLGPMMIMLRNVLVLMGQILFEKYVWRE